MHSDAPQNLSINISMPIARRLCLIVRECVVQQLPGILLFTNDIAQIISSFGYSF